MSPRVVAASFVLLALSVTSLASAQTVPSEPPPPEAQTVEPLPPPATAAEPAPLPPAPVVATPSGDAGAIPTDDGAFARRMLRVIGEDARTVRLATGGGLVLTGVGSIAAGVLADASYHQSYGQVLWIGGIAVATSGLVSLFSSTPTEVFARNASTLSPRELEARWAAMAERSRTARKVGGVASVIVGGIAAGTGAALASGAGNLENDSKQAWSVALIAGGAAMLGGGLAAFLVESPLEHGYRAAYGTAAASPDVAVSVAPTTRGAAASLQMRF
ncbi:hypothetical protein AKJ09_07576 [Labilithrix luteola]|uniref:Uncharacterized protein n=1 Tax=Labilithrix luteola TaxID=1391654 RepID=A0A0K1Q5A3_9BACT|nr:hypothetical protein [Labilithrix luteola]AKV00913.1 hypothetical protein AKJ09_07576 [Labilithrix luteola]